MYCEQTGKITYDSKHDAELVLRSKEERNNAKKRARSKKVKVSQKETTAYKCKFCNGWHLAGKKH